MNPFSKKSKKKQKEQQMLSIIGSLENIQECVFQKDQQLLHIVGSLEDMQKRVQRNEMMLVEQREIRQNTPPIWNPAREKSYSADEIMNTRPIYTAFTPRSTQNLRRINSGFSSKESLRREMADMEAMYEQRLQKKEGLIQQLLENKNQTDIGRDEIFYEENEDLMSDSPYATALGYSMVDFVDNFLPDTFLDRLVSKEIVAEREEESIRCEKTRESRTRLLITILRKKSDEQIEEFLEILNSDPGHAQLCKQVKQRLVTGPRSRVCEFCYISHYVDIRPIADEMCGLLNPDDFRCLTNERIAITTRWQKMNELTRISPKIRNNFLRALETNNPNIAAKVQFNLRRGSLECCCPNEHRRIAKSSVSTDDIPLMLSDPYLVNEDDDELSTIRRYTKDEEASKSRGASRNNAIDDMPTEVLNKTYETCNGSPKANLHEEDITLKKDRWSRTFKMVMGFMMLLVICSMILSATVSVANVSTTMVDAVYKTSFQVIDSSMGHLSWVHGVI
ncbi:hypothetical protein SNE40_004199 [Patella caerulea]|uniref:CARD domain-containing protein n=1 Tax=Patella caerulea TaxID=87958 RepID=A0AAN8Q6C5_PATCE